MLEALGARVWTITSPPASPRPLRPASWATIAKVRSSARKSGKRRVASASRIALSVTSGKSWPLATIWVPTRTPLGASPKRGEDAGVGAALGGGVGVEPEDRHRRQALAQQRLDPLGAGAGPRERRRGALRAGPRRGSAWAQWWQTRRPLWRWTISETSQLGQLQWCPQERQVSQGAKPRRLIITIALAPAARTPSSASQVSACSGPRAGVGLAHVDQLDRRHAQAVDPPRQLQPRQLQPGLRARRRGAGDEHGAAVRGAAAGDRAGVVAGVALLLVGGVVLLVDDDQAEVADRGEDGRARADADARLAAAQPPPLVVALAGGEGRVEDREAVAEAGAEAGHRLRGEADLGDEDDRAPAPLQRRLDRRQVDLGLARAGDAVQQLAARARRPRRRGRRRSRRPRAAARAAGSGGRPGRRGRSRAGARRRRELRVAIRPRSSSRRSVWRSEPTAAASSPPTSRRPAAPPAPPAA